MVALRALEKVRHFGVEAYSRLVAGDVAAPFRELADDRLDAADLAVDKGVHTEVFVIGYKQFYGAVAGDIFRTDAENYLLPIVIL